MESRIIFITGGCRSGKSYYALDYADRHFSKKIYLATGEALDEEMAQRIERHKKLRGPEWRTIEEPIEIVDQIRLHGHGVEVILLDCLTLWLSNLLMKQDDDSRIIRETERLIETMKRSQTSFLVVSNEVGMGIVPADPLSRRFRDLSGRTNQKMAEAAQTAILMVSGIPVFLKGGT